MKEKRKRVEAKNLPTLKINLHLDEEREEGLGKKGEFLRKAAAAAA